MTDDTTRSNWLEEMTNLTTKARLERSPQTHLCSTDEFLFAEIAKSGTIPMEFVGYAQGLANSNGGFREFLNSHPKLSAALSR